jgi:hypothetical protein
MNSTRIFAIGFAGLAICASALLLISGCGKSHTPQGLADEALRPTSTPEEEAEQEKAIIELASQPFDKPGVKEALRTVAAKSDKPKIRTQAIFALGNMKDRESAEMFIKYLSSDDKYERGRAYLAVSGLIGLKIPFNIDDPDPESRKDAIVEIKKNVDFFKKKWDTDAANK